MRPRNLPFLDYSVDLIGGERLYQIEIQLLNLPDLPARILYGWADLYSAQLQDGDSYARLQPTYAIWLLGKTLRPRIAEAVHRFRWRDDQGRNLVQERSAKEQEWSAKEQERAAEERERTAKEAALAEIERLKTLLGN